MAKKRVSLQSNRVGPNGEKPTKPKTKVRPKYGVKANSTLKKGNHSLNPDRVATGPHMRSRATINRLRMYKNFKPIRNSRGKIIKAAPFQERLPSGSVARVEPNRKWFGNTRVVGQEQLQKFQENIGKIVSDPFQVVMRQTKLPISLLSENSKQQRVHIIDTESFEYTFGKKALRKRPTIAVENLEQMREEAEKKVDGYSVSSDKDLSLDEDKERVENPNPLFRAGQSHRVWGELYKVLDSSDVVIEVIDARNPIGTRCVHVEEFLKREKPHKHLFLVMNKVDLVPTWITRKWLGILGKELPTVAFHASMQHSFGKKSVIDLLRQFAHLHKERQQISVGLIGYPNVGKSSIINTLRSKRVCKTAPIAGETKVWQYVTLMRRIFLIDCPGVVYPQGDTETETILKGVVRVENVKDPEIHIQEVLNRVSVIHLQRTYNIESWSDSHDFLTILSYKMGRLLKGGEPDTNAVARIVLNDVQRGRLPYFVPPPGCENYDDQNEKCKEENIKRSSSGVSEGEDVHSQDDSNAKAVNEENKDILEEDESEDEGSLTDIGSTVSGLSDISGLSDLDDVEMLDRRDYAVDFGDKDYESEHKKPHLKVRSRGRRAGKKLTEKKNRLKKCAGQYDMSENFADLNGGRADVKRNLWFKKLKKRRKVKHQL